MKHKIITPLNKFPTQVLLYQYKQNRICRDKIIKDKLLRVDKMWIPHYTIIDGEKVEEYYELLECPRYSYKTVVEVHCKQDEHFEWKGDFFWYGDHIHINFEGMHWEGELQELHDELDSREHIGTLSKKEFRQWLINYRKNKKNGKYRYK